MGRTGGRGWRARSLGACAAAVVTSQSCAVTRATTAFTGEATTGRAMAVPGKCTMIGITRARDMLMTMSLCKIGGPAACAQMPSSEAAGRFIGGRMSRAVWLAARADLVAAAPARADERAALCEPIIRTPDRVDELRRLRVDRAVPVPQRGGADNPTRPNHPAWGHEDINFVRASASERERGKVRRSDRMIGRIRHRGCGCTVRCLSPDGTCSDE